MGSYKIKNQIIFFLVPKGKNLGIEINEIKAKPHSSPVAQYLT